MKDSKQQNWFVPYFLTFIMLDTFPPNRAPWFHYRNIIFEYITKLLNPLNAELNPIRHLLALVGATIFSTLAG